RDTERLTQLDHELEARKEQSLRQVGGLLWTLTQSYDRAQRRGEELLIEKLTLPNTVKLIFNKGDWRHEFQQKADDDLRDTIHKQIANSLELLESDLRGVWQQLHESLRKQFDEQRTSTSFPDFVQQREQLLRRVELTLLERGSSQQVEEHLGKLFSETANWLRVPAGVAAGAGLATLVAAMAHAAIVDVTGTIAGVAAVTGTVLAVFKRQQILAEFRKQTAEKRETILRGIEEHLRHAIEKFYQELGAMFQPLQTFCAAQRKLFEPMSDRIRELEGTFGKRATALGLAPRRGNLPE
ncbi:MAG: hypothetical protein M3463_16635, partial [Verrucomicrobiota bacterium]|nr:hypothetical protein [Verrucomicrobiota bacterium]